MELAPLMQLPGTLRALRHRNYRLYFFGQITSMVGTWMQTVAQAWLVYRLTKSSALLGAVGFTSQIPVLLLAPFGGAVADRYPKHPIIVATQVASMILAFVLAALTLTGSIQIWEIFVLSALLGVVNAFDFPARQAFNVEMVGKADLMNAVALNVSIVNASRIVGPAVAGILVAILGEGWCFFGNGVSFLAVIAGLLRMRLAPDEEAQHSGSPLENIREGYRFIRSQRALYSLLLLVATMSLTAMPYSTMMPIFAGDILHGGPQALGLLMGCGGIGALAAAVRLASRRDLGGLEHWMIGGGVAGGVLLAAFACSRSFALSLAIMAPMGFGMMTALGASNTLLQSMAPDRLRGRIMSFHTMMFFGTAPVGSLVAGAVAEKFGAPLTVSIGGLVSAAAYAIFWMGLKKFDGNARELQATHCAEGNGSAASSPTPELPTGARTL